MSKSKAAHPHTSPQVKKKKQARREQRDRARAKKRTIIIGLSIFVVVLLGGYALYASQQNSRQIYDLSGIGQGIPAVVQVHDTTCPVCTELRENIRLIEDDYPDDVLLIRVANVFSDEGLAFIEPHTTNRRVTLLFFDGAGNLTNTQVGLKSVTDLRLAFQRHLDK